MLGDRPQRVRRHRSAACSTTVEVSGSATVKWAKPQEWNRGAAIIVVSRARSGIFENSAATGSIESGCRRAAPFGVPVVPEVRITVRPGLGRRLQRPVVAALDQVLAAAARPVARAPSGSLQDSRRLRPRAPSSTSSANSSS